LFPGSVEVAEETNLELIREEELNEEDFDDTADVEQDPFDAHTL
jgi:hypothetical protein